MQTLNLINKAKSDIDYTIDKFPDGQINIHLNNINRKNGAINIICRIVNSDDIMLLMMISDILSRQEVKVNNLYITYLLCARMDRVMDFNQPYSLKIISKIINSLNASSVFIQTPHSNKSLELIENSRSAFDVFNHQKCYDYLINVAGKKIQYVYPDEGAYNRYYTPYIESIEDTYLSMRNNIKLPFISDLYIKCTKHRDSKTNELSNFEITNDSVLDTSTNMLIVKDDLCDGGGTFIGVGKLLRDKYKNYFSNKDNKLILCVTHMIQGINAVPKLLEIYDEVWFTDSYKNWNEKDFIGYENKIKIFNVTDIPLKYVICGSNM